MPAENILLASLGMRPEFDDFNFSSLCDSSLKQRLGESALIGWVIQGREDDVGSISDFADAMYFSLRPAAFEAYQRWHGPVAISSAEWFYLKLRQFFHILSFDEVEVKSLVDGSRKRTRLPLEDNFEITGVRCHPEVELEELTESIAPEDNDFETWFRLAEEICYCPGNRLQELQGWLKKHRRASGSRGSIKSGWAKNHERDAVICSELSGGTERIDICRRLDRRGIDPTPGLQRRGFARWLDAWSDADGRQSVQTLFSKVGRR